MNVEEIRACFPMLQKTMHGAPLVYFDSAATAQKPQCVIDAVQDFYQCHYGTVHRALYELSVFSTRQYSLVREQIQAFLGAALAEEIIYTKGTTESINLVASSFGRTFLNEGDEVLVSAMEHHANIVPWQMICQQRKAVLRVIPMNDRGELQLDALQQMLSPKVKLVAVAHVSNVLGTINPIKQIAAMVHPFGAYLLVDGAQGIPHIAVDVQDLDVDFYAFSGHKLYGPTGIGVLYGKKHLLEQLPPYQGGGDMVQTVSFAETTYNVLPFKFEAGTPMIAEVIGLGAAIDFVKKIGLSEICEREKILLEYATQKMVAIPGLRIIGQAAHKGAIMTFDVENVHSLDIGTLLDLHGIAIRTGGLCAHPTLHHFGIKCAARVSFAFYNTIQEIDRFIEALKDVLSQLR